jgi:hypothetical protein
MLRTTVHLNYTAEINMLGTVSEGRSGNYQLSM